MTSLLEERFKNNVMKQTGFHNAKTLGSDLPGKLVFFEKQNKTMRTKFNS